MQYTLNPSADTQMISDAPTTNYATDANLGVGEFKGATSSRRSLIKFDLSSVSGTITAGTLRIYDDGQDFSDNIRTMSVYRTVRDWVENQATWNIFSTGNNWGTAGCDNTTTDRNAAATGSISMPATEVAGYVDITMDASILEDMRTGTNYGFVIRMATETDDGHNFNSNDGVNKPQLVITDTTPTPDTLNRSYSFIL